MEPTWYTIKQVAEIAERSTGTVKRAIAKHRLKSSQANGPQSPHMIRREWIDEWLEPNTDPAAVAADVSDIIGAGVR
jgi:hypothetical protein